MLLWHDVPGAFRIHFPLLVTKAPIAVSSPSLRLAKNLQTHPEPCFGIQGPVLLLTYRRTRGKRVPSAADATTSSVPCCPHLLQNC